MLGFCTPICLGVYILGVYILGVYTLGVYALEQAMLDLATHTLDWGLHIEGLQCRATDSGSRNPVIGLGVNTLGVYTRSVQSLGPPIRDSRKPFIGLGVYFLGVSTLRVCSLG